MNRDPADKNKPFLGFPTAKSFGITPKGIEKLPKRYLGSFLLFSDAMRVMRLGAGAPINHYFARKKIPRGNNRKVLAL